MRQKAVQAEEGASDYEFAEKFVVPGKIGDAITLDSQYLNLFANESYQAAHGLTALPAGFVNPYEGYLLSTLETQKTKFEYVTENGELVSVTDLNSNEVKIYENDTSIFYVYYDWDDWENPPDVSGTFQLTFVNTLTGKPIPFELENGNSITVQELAYNAELKDHVPKVPTSQGYDFSGWYADETCATRVYFTQEEWDAHPGSVYFANMPATNLTIYAGWERQWFLIQIDPNYGALYEYDANGELKGTGSTWFWKEYGDTFQEYVTVRRDYVESDTGNWYFRKEDRAYYGYPNTWISGEKANRRTFYTKDPAEATDFQTFVYEPGVYRYAGWYEVLYDEDGNEIGVSDERYDFTSKVTHDITLRLRWMKVGAFYLKYEAGEGKLYGDEENEKLYIELDSDTYADDADVVVTRAAIPPAGKEFIGWRIRGDETDTVYQPGQTIHMLSRYMASVQGKQTMFLEAVYAIAPTARIRYHANGGTLRIDPTDPAIQQDTVLNNKIFGYPRHGDATAADYQPYYTAFDGDVANIWDIINNNYVVLSDGDEWLSRTDATFAGWCDQPVYDPNDEEHPLLLGGVENNNYHADGVTDLYAVWETDVRFFLNGEHELDKYGIRDWDYEGSPFTRATDPVTGEKYYKRTVYIGNGIDEEGNSTSIGDTIGWPPYDPVCGDENANMFLYWATKDGQNVYNRFFFDEEPVTGPLDLYAVWASAYHKVITIADASEEIINDVTTASFTDEETGATMQWSPGYVELTTMTTSPEDLAKQFNVPTMSNGNGGYMDAYSFAFATVLNTQELKSLQYLENKPIYAIYYNVRDDKTHVEYSITDADILAEASEHITANGRDWAQFESAKDGKTYIAIRDTSTTGISVIEDVELQDYERIHFVFFRNKSLNIGYVSMDYQTNIRTLTTQDFTPKKTRALRGGDVYYTNTPFKVLQTQNKNAFDLITEGRQYHYFSFGFSNVEDPNLAYQFPYISAGGDENANPPEIWIRNTWRGFQYSEDEGNTWFAAGYDPHTFVIYYQDQPTVVNFRVETFGLAADQDKGFSFDYWVDKISLKEGHVGEVIERFYSTRDVNGELGAGVVRADPVQIRAQYEYSTILFTQTQGDNPYTLRVTMLQLPEEGFETTVEPFDEGNTQEVPNRLLQWTEEDDEARAMSWTAWPGEQDGSFGKTKNLTFTLRRNTFPVEIHLAHVDQQKSELMRTDEWRSSDGEDYKFTLKLQTDGYEKVFDETYIRNITDPNKIRGNVVFGAMFYGSDTYHLENDKPVYSPIKTVIDPNFYSVSVEPLDPANQYVYSVYLKDMKGNRYRLYELARQQSIVPTAGTATAESSPEYNIYFLYYPRLTIHYVEELSDGSLVPITGAPTLSDGTENTGYVTYDGDKIIMNPSLTGGVWDAAREQWVGAQPITPMQFVELPLTVDAEGNTNVGLTITQEAAGESAGNIFNIPPLLDNGEKKLDLVYYKLGADAQEDYQYVAQNISELTDEGDDWHEKPNAGVTEDLILYTLIRNNTFEWRFTFEEWTKINKHPVVYAIYRERGYDLTISKTVPEETDYNEPFTVTVESTSINRDKYAVDGTGYSTISATPGNQTTPGRITFDVLDGDKVTIIGLAPGEYRIRESGNANFTLQATSREEESAEDPTPIALDATDPNSMTIQLNKSMTVNLINTPNEICRIGERYFTSLRSAVAYVEGYLTSKQTIEMVVPEYLLPASDMPEILSYLDITLTTAPVEPENPRNQITDGKTAVIKRKDNLPGAMISNLGTLTLQNVTLEGNIRTDANNKVVPYTSPLIHNEGKLTIADGTTLKNGYTSGQGGAIYGMKGSVAMTGGTIQNCTAAGDTAKGGAIYIENGSLTLQGGTIQNCSTSTDGGAVYYAGSDTVTVSGTTLQDNTASRGGAFYLASGNLSMTGGNLTGNRVSAKGGAVYAHDAYVTISGGEISGNSAVTDGGAIHMETLALIVNGGKINSNQAAQGGAIWTGTGSVSVSGGELDSNTATSQNGGAIYADKSEVTVTGGKIERNVAEQSGGAIYAESGSVTYTGGTGKTINNNTATAGNGGGIYAGSGSVTINASSAMRGNHADHGKGGAVYVGTGAAILKRINFDGSASGIYSENPNTAINGAAVFVDKGSATFDGGTIKANMASEGGAVGVGSADVRLYFQKAVNISGNTMTSGDASVASNVYLDFDTDAILNFQSLSNDTNSYVGIYAAEKPVVADGKNTTVLARRGVPSTRFGVYVNTVTLSKIHNDRTDTLVVKQDKTNKKLFWTRDFTIKALYCESFAVGLPFASYNGAVMDYTNNFKKFDRTADGTPPSYQNAASTIAEDIRRLAKAAGKTIGNDNAVFAAAFVQGASVSEMDYANYLTNINWNTTTNLWDFVLGNGSVSETSADKKTLIFFYSQPYYLSIENNASVEMDNTNRGLTLEITGLEIQVNNVWTSVIENYGYVFARNDEIQDELMPVKAGDLVLRSGDSIRILLPGGKNMDYQLTGTYYSTYDPEHPENNVVYPSGVSYRQIDVNANPQQKSGTTAPEAGTSFTLTGKTPNTATGTHQLIFGPDRAICKIAVGKTIAGAEPTEYVQHEKGEYTFASLMQAYTFIENHKADFIDAQETGSAYYTIRATIEMLTDYLIPPTDQLNLNKTGGKLTINGTEKQLSRSITLQTAVNGYFRHEGPHKNKDGKPRAVMSRGAGNQNSFVVAPNGTLQNNAYLDTLTLNNLVFDGKSFGGDNIEGGSVKTKGWNVEITDVDFRNCRARYGGGVFIESVWPTKGDKTPPYGYLTVTDSSFMNCQSLLATDKFGGGGIWTSMREMTITNCSFDSCEGAATIGTDKNAQGGGVFHFVGDIDAAIPTKSTVVKCTFNNCSANAAGSMECGAREVWVTGCTFRNSIAKTKNGGALNVWVYDNEKNNKDSWLYVTDCFFESCYCISEDTSKGNGGAMRSTAKYNTITNCTFTNVIGSDGGAMNFTNNQANTKTEILGCEINNCSARKHGGAVYCVGKTLLMDSYVKTDENGTVVGNSIRNCNAKYEGGAVYHTGATELSVKNTVIDTCWTTDLTGGGVYSTAAKAAFADSTVMNCYTMAANQGGGGVHLTASTNTTFANVTVRNNTATGIGGGLYHNNKGTLTVTDSSFTQNIAQGDGDTDDNKNALHNSGGGIYTKAASFTLQNSVVSDNQGYGNGGGICHNNNDATSLTLDGCTISGNLAGHTASGTDYGKGAGVYTLTNLKLKGKTTVTGNRLRTESDQDAAGIYLKDGITVSLGTDGGTKDDHVFLIRENYTVDGKPSDLRLPDTGSGANIVNANNVVVNSDIDGEVRVVNAKKKLTQFGTAKGKAFPLGFTDSYKVFWSDDGSLYGIVDRDDESGKKIIWGGDPICKITDGNGRLLYLDENLVRPAVFDRLDNGVTDKKNAQYKSKTSAFSTLRGQGYENSPFYYYDGQGNAKPYTGPVFHVKMLVEEYRTEYAVLATSGLNGDPLERTITLTTAKTTDSLHPYRGREGTRCTILREPKSDGTVDDKPLLTAQTNMILQNIVLDGGSLNGVTAAANTRVVTASAANEEKAIQLTLGRNAAVQNGSATGNGGGVYLNYGAQLSIAGGSIRNCTAQNGGGVYIDGGKGTMTMAVGSITSCTASQNGGGVYFYKGALGPDTTNPTYGFIKITGGSINRNNAEEGGGIYLNTGENNKPTQRTMYMSGGSIVTNHATGIGGGVAIGNDKSRIYLSGQANITGNKSDASRAADKACNVEMGHMFNRDQDIPSNPGTVLVVTERGLLRGATIGVYVPGEDNKYPASKPGEDIVPLPDDSFLDTATVYDKHGDLLDPFATFQSGVTHGLNYFVNDRNGMKGGLLDEQTTDDMKVYWRKIYGLTVTKRVLSDSTQYANDPFYFRVEVMGPDGKLIEGQYGDMVFQKGVASFALKNGETKTADLLDVYSTYRITEILTAEEAAYFKTTVENWDGTAVSGTEVTGRLADPEIYTYRVTFANLHAICKLTDENDRLLYWFGAGEYHPAVYSALVSAFNQVNQTDNIWYVRSGEGTEEDSFEQAYPTSYKVKMLIPDYTMSYKVELQNDQIVELTTAERITDPEYYNDGFPYVGGNEQAIVKRGFEGESLFTVQSGSLTIGRITLDGNGQQFKANPTIGEGGGLVCVQNGGTLTVGDNSVLQNSLSSEIKMNHAAVYLAEGSRMNISGSPVFSGNKVKYWTNDAQAQNNTNGGEHVYSDQTTRMDIYIAGYRSKDAASLVVTGDITSEQGSIWVRANEDPHFKQGKQFALMENLTGDEPHSGLDVFRNACDDAKTGNNLANKREGEPKYLYGVGRGGKVYWNGDVELAIIKKIEGEFSSPTNRFGFTVSGLENGAVSYTRYRSTNGGTTWDKVENAPTLTVQNGKLRFELGNFEKIVLNVPIESAVTIAEQNDYYTAGYLVYNKDSTTPAASGTTASTGTITMNNDKTVEFTNTMNAPSPSGVSFRVLPFVILLVAGGILLAVFLIGKRRKDRDD